MHKNKEAPDTPNTEEFRVIHGKKYRRIDTGYTIREYYSHSTPEKGPGPGWDWRWDTLEKHSVKHPSELPNDPLYQWELVDEIPESPNSNT